MVSLKTVVSTIFFLFSMYVLVILIDFIYAFLLERTVHLGKFRAGNSIEAKIENTKVVPNHGIAWLDKI